MEGLEKNKKILFSRHLEEVDDLKTYGRDAPLVDTEKNKEYFDEIVNTIVSKLRESNRKAIMFVTSPRLRARETAQLVGVEIKKRIGDIKIRYTSEDDLRAPEQGEFILPEGYAVGSFFEGLKIASDIFYKESLNFSDPNFHYKFGDPMLKNDGSYKYPVLVEYFKTSGETYAESLSRILKLVVKMGQKVEKLNSSIEVVIVAHGFTLQILRGLSVLAEKIKNDNTQVDIGGIPHELSKIYEKRPIELKELMCVPLDITNLGDRDLLDRIEKEISFLERK